MHASMAPARGCRPGFWHRCLPAHADACTVAPNHTSPLPSPQARSTPSLTGIRGGQTHIPAVHACKHGTGKGLPARILAQMLACSCRCMHSCTQPYQPPALTPGKVCTEFDRHQRQPIEFLPNLRKLDPEPPARPPLRAQPSSRGCPAASQGQRWLMYRVCCRAGAIISDVSLLDGSCLQSICPSRASPFWTPLPARSPLRTRPPSGGAALSRVRRPLHVIFMEVPCQKVRKHWRMNYFVPSRRQAFPPRSRSSSAPAPSSSNAWHRHQPRRAAPHRAGRAHTLRWSSSIGRG